MQFPYSTSKQNYDLQKMPAEDKPEGLQKKEPRLLEKGIMKEQQNDWILVSFYTKGTGYKDCAKRLEASLLPLKVPFEIDPVPNLKDWNKNCHFKAEFIKAKMEQHPDKSIVWVDADAVFHQYPALFDRLAAGDFNPPDFAAHYRIWIHNPNELLSGTLFFKNSLIMKDVVSEWIKMNRKQPSNWDQRNLQRVIKRNRFLINVYNLPIEYCCIFDDAKRKKIDPIIEHFQASRKLRRAVKQGR